MTNQTHNRIIRALDRYVAQYQKAKASDRDRIARDVGLYVGLTAEENPNHYLDYFMAKVHPQHPVQRKSWFCEEVCPVKHVIDCQNKPKIDVEDFI